MAPSHPDKKQSLQFPIWPHFPHLLPIFSFPLGPHLLLLPVPLDHWTPLAGASDGGFFRAFAPAVLSAWRAITPDSFTSLRSSIKLPWPPYLKLQTGHQKHTHTHVHALNTSIITSSLAFFFFFFGYVSNIHF